MTDEEAAKELLALPSFLETMARGPCACGKRKHGTHVKPMEEIKITRVCFNLIEQDYRDCYRGICRMKCEICGHEENAVQYVNITKYPPDAPH